MYHKNISPKREDAFLSESLEFPLEEKSQSFSYNLSAHSYHSQSSDSIPYVSNETAWKFEGFSLESDDASNFLSEFKASSPTFEYSSTFGDLPTRISISSHSWTSGSSSSMTGGNISKNPYVNTLSSKEVILSVLEFVKQQRNNSGDNTTSTISNSLGSDKEGGNNSSIHQLLYEFPNLNSIASNKRITKLLFEKLQLFPADADGTPMDYLPSCGAKTNLLTLGVNDFVVVEKSSSATIMHIRIESNHETGFSMNIQNMSDRENSNQSTTELVSGAIPIPIPIQSSTKKQFFDKNQDPYNTVPSPSNTTTLPHHHHHHHHHRHHKLQTELLHLSTNSHAFFSSDSEEDSEADEEEEESSEYSSDFQMNARQSSQESNADVIQCFRTDTDEKLLRLAAAAAVTLSTTSTPVIPPPPVISPPNNNRIKPRTHSPDLLPQQQASRYPGNMMKHSLPGGTGKEEEEAQEEEEEMYTLLSDEEITPAMLQQTLSETTSPFVTENLNTLLLAQASQKKKGRNSSSKTNGESNHGVNNNTESNKNTKKKSSHNNSNTKKNNRGRSSSGSLMIACRRPGSERWRVAKQLLVNAKGEFISFERVITEQPVKEADEEEVVVMKEQQQPPEYTVSSQKKTLYMEDDAAAAEIVGESVPLRSTSKNLSIDTNQSYHYLDGIASPIHNKSPTKTATSPFPKQRTPNAGAATVAGVPKEFPLATSKKLHNTLSNLSLIASPAVPINIATTGNGNGNNGGGLERRHTDHPDYYSSNSMYDDADEEYLRHWSGRPTPTAAAAASNTFTNGGGGGGGASHVPYYYTTLYGTTSSKLPSTTSSVNGDYGFGMDSANSSSHGPPPPTSTGMPSASATSSARSSGTGMQLHNLSLLNPHSSFNIIAQFSPTHGIDRFTGQAYGGSVRGSVTGGSRSVYEEDEEEYHHGVWITRSNTPTPSATTPGLSKATSINSIASLLENPTAITADQQQLQQQQQQQQHGPSTSVRMIPPSFNNTTSMSMKGIPTTSATTTAATAATNTNTVRSRSRTLSVHSIASTTSHKSNPGTNTNMNTHHNHHQGNPGNAGGTAGGNTGNASQQNRRRARTSSTTSNKSHSSITSSSGGHSNSHKIQDHTATMVRLQAQKMLRSSAATGHPSAGHPHHHRRSMSSDSSGLEMDSEEEDEEEDDEEGEGIQYRHNSSSDEDDEEDGDELHHPHHPHLHHHHYRHHHRRSCDSSDSDNEYDQSDIGEQSMHQEEDEEEDEAETAVREAAVAVAEEEDDRIIQVSRTSRHSSLVHYTSPTSSRRPSGMTNGSSHNSTSSSQHTATLLQAALAGSTLTSSHSHMSLLPQPQVSQGLQGMSRRSSRSSTTNGTTTMSDHEGGGGVGYYDDGMSISSVDEWYTIGTTPSSPRGTTDTAAMHTLPHESISIITTNTSLLSTGSLEYSPTSPLSTSSVSMTTAGSISGSISGSGSSSSGGGGSSNNPANKKVGFFTRMLHSIFSKPSPIEEDITPTNHNNIPTNNNNTNNTTTNNTTEDISSSSLSTTTTFTTTTTSAEPFPDSERSSESTSTSSSSPAAAPVRRRSFFGSFLSASSSSNSSIGGGSGSMGNIPTTTLPSATSTIFEVDEEHEEDSIHGAGSSLGSGSHHSSHLPSMGMSGGRSHSASSIGNGGTGSGISTNGGGRSKSQSSPHNSGRFTFRLSMNSTTSSGGGGGFSHMMYLEEDGNENENDHNEQVQEQERIHQTIAKLRLEKAAMEAEEVVEGEEGVEEEVMVNAPPLLPIPLVQNLDTGDVFPLGVLRYEPCILPPTVPPTVLFQ